MDAAPAPVLATRWQVVVGRKHYASQSNEGGALLDRDFEIIAHSAGKNRQRKARALAQVGEKLVGAAERLARGRRVMGGT